MNLVDRVKKHIEEIGDCWEWHGATQSVSTTPVIRMPKATMGVLRALAIDRGLNVTGKIVTNTCRNPKCVNPDHLKVTTRKQLQQTVVKEQGYHRTIGYRMAVSRGVEGSLMKLTPSQVLEIRSSAEPTEALAREYGVSHCHVNAIKRGYARSMVGGNPFAGLMR